MIDRKLEPQVLWSNGDGWYARLGALNARHFLQSPRLITATNLKLSTDES